jgi:hypothetical protein
LSFISRTVSAIGKLAFVGLLLVAFIIGMAGVVYMSLSGTEVKVPDIVGKDFVESEKELASLGLKIKRRADRASTDKINTVLEQLPKPGETVKTGQMILVVVSKAGAAGEDAPPSLKKDIEEDDTEKIGEMISDKPKKNKANTNSNTNKKTADTTRDVIANTSTSVSNDSGDASADKKDVNPEDKTRTDGEKGEKGDKKETTPKSTSTPVTTKPSTVKTPSNEPRSRPNRR